MNDISYIQELGRNLELLGGYDLSDISEAVNTKLEDNDAVYKHCKCEEIAGNLIITLQNGVPSAITLRGYKESGDSEMIYRREIESGFSSPHRRIYDIVDETKFYEGYTDLELSGLHEVVTGILDVVSIKNN